MNDMTSEFEKANITLAASATIHLDGGDGDLKCKMERLKVSWDNYAKTQLYHHRR